MRRSPLACSAAARRQSHRAGRGNAGRGWPVGQPQPSILPKCRAGCSSGLPSRRRLIKRPRILLLDEPFGALDPGIRTDMHALITRLWREFGLTIIMVTHDIKEAFGLGTRVLTLDKRRHDPHAPHRYGAGVIYDIALTRRMAAEAEMEAGITIDTNGNN